MPVSASLLNFDQLLTPISPDNPCGESLRYDPVYTELKQFRLTRKDPLHSSGDKLPEWDKVEKISIDLLAKRSKDLMLAGWLSEALLRRHGFAGLRDGVKLISGLIERFWDGIHPLPDEGDMSVRTSPLSWLASDNSGARFSAVVREVKLAPSSNSDIYNWNFWHLRRVSPQAEGEKEDAFKKRKAEAGEKEKAFDAAVDSAPISFYQNLSADIDACTAEIDLLKTALNTRLGDDSPVFDGMLSAIADIRSFVQSILKRRGGLPAESSDVADTVAADGQTPSQSNGDNSANVRGGPIRSRADAIARLEEVATFFSDTEPHSPVSYLVRRSIRWAGMPFADVLGELVKDDKLVKQIGETLGIVSGPTK